MELTACERALTRVISYLTWSGVELTDQVCRTALETVIEALAQGTDRLPERALDNFLQRFDPPVPPLPRATPILRRTSMGYG